MPEVRPVSVRPMRGLALTVLAAALLIPSAVAAAGPAEMTTEAAAVEWRTLACPGNLAEVVVTEMVTAAGIADGDPLTDELRAAAGVWADRLDHAAVRLAMPAMPWPAAIRADVGRVAGLEAIEAERVGTLARAGSTWSPSLTADEVAFEKAAVDRIRTALGLPLESDCTEADAPPAVMTMEQAATAWLDAICPLNAASAALSAYSKTLADPAILDDTMRLLLGRYGIAVGRAAALFAHPVAPWPAEIADQIDRQGSFFTWQASLYTQITAADAVSAPSNGEDNARAREASTAIRTALGLGEAGTGCPA